MSFPLRENHVRFATAALAAGDIATLLEEAEGEKRVTA